MKPLVFHIAVFILFAGVLSGCRQAHSEQPLHVLATVNDAPIDADEFRMGYMDLLIQTGQHDTFARRMHFLNARIAARLLVQEARQNGLHETAAYEDAVDHIEKKLLVDVYLEKALFDTLQIHESELQDLFVRANTTLTARHLYAKTYEEALQLEKRLKNGERFEDLAREIFADSVLATSGGSVGSFTLDEMDPAFEDAAFLLEIGEISGPVRTRQGYSIIQLEDRFTKPLITEYEFAEKRDRMAHFVSYRKKKAARTQHTDDQIAALSPVFEEPAMVRLLDQITGLPDKSGPETEDAFLQLPLVRFHTDAGPEAWTIGTFRAHAAMTSEAQRARVNDRASLEKFIEGLILREEMIRLARLRGYDVMPDVERVRERAIRDWLWDKAVNTLYEDVVVPEDSIRGHYEAFRDGYRHPAEVRIEELLVRTKREAVRLKAQLDTIDFAELARLRSIRPGADQFAGDLGWLSEVQLGVLAGPVSQAGTGDVIGPLEFKGHYVLLRIGERRPSRQMTYEAARPEIERHLTAPFRKLFLQAHIERLKRDADIFVDKEQLAKLSIRESQHHPKNLFEQVDAGSTEMEKNIP